MTMAQPGDRPLEVLVVDDEPRLAKALSTILADRGHHVRVAGRGAEALVQFAESVPDVIVLDLMLPDISGFEVLETVRQTSDVPVVVLSVRDREEDKIRALDLGADDYLTKPFSAAELLARIRAAGRRSASQASLSGELTVGEISINSNTRAVRVGPREIRLTPREYDLLTYLARNPGRVLTYRNIMVGAWGGEHDDVQLLRVHMSNLRKKIEEVPADPRHILTEPGVGFRLVG